MTARGAEVMAPCPFCGGEAFIIPVPPPRHGQQTLHRPQCRQCGCDLGAFATRTLALAVWNRRPEAPRRENEVLEQAAKACEQQAAEFLSPEYATGQPLSSFNERFACGQCAAAIRAMKVEG